MYRIFRLSKLFYFAWQKAWNFLTFILTLFDTSIEFFLNDFLWIQWIMIKCKNSIVTIHTLYLTIDTFLDVVVKKKFPLLSVGWYLFRVVSGDRYLPRGSNENALCITSTGNIFVSSWVIPLVTIPLLDLVMIHWIRWIQGNSFRKNSINDPQNKRFSMKTDWHKRKSYQKRRRTYSVVNFFYSNIFQRWMQAVAINSKTVD